MRKLILLIIAHSICLCKISAMEQKARPTTPAQNPANELLLQGARLNNNTQIWLALNNKADVNSKNEFGQTAIHILMLNLNSTNKDQTIQNIQFLLNRNTDVSIVDFNNSNPIHYAVKQNESEISQILIEKLKKNYPEKLTFALNCQDLEKGRTPLHYSVINGNVMLTALLLVNKANINIKDNNGYTPINYINRMRNTKIKAQLKKLIESLIKESTFYLPPIKTNYLKALLDLKNTNSLEDEK